MDPKQFACRLSNYGPRVAKVQAKEIGKVGKFEFGRLGDGWLFMATFYLFLYLDIQFT